ncbi:hypothetical protein K443DRAFT_420629 [Laccaria amethystina LaAM-08-1]|uniref:Uncharacterized protein n=1 Tax=Laccaria amethystina LaAM-08-1 TaxID=1095629 RepID=A0A0C9X8W5_9AGAR|nr:hypothetical protein K443DRAFT_420629 [Laccaria amethystina LaAM-08-1]
MYLFSFLYRSRRSSDGDKTTEETNEKMKVSWLCHACSFIEFPSRLGDRGVCILFNPVFSNRCSPSQRVGPKQYTHGSIPEVDAIVMSVRFATHTRAQKTIITISSALIIYPTRPLPITISAHLCAARERAVLQRLGVAASHTHIIDWWDSKRLKVSVAGKDNQPRRRRLHLHTKPALYWPFDF